MLSFDTYPTDSNVQSNVWSCIHETWVRSIDTEWGCLAHLSAVERGIISSAGHVVYLENTGHMCFGDDQFVNDDHVALSKVEGNIQHGNEQTPPDGGSLKPQARFFRFKSHVLLKKVANENGLTR